jgi:hypothetical protein
MNEQEWLQCVDLEVLLRSVWATGSDRKKRLFVCSFCRAIPGLLEPDPVHAAIAVAERYAEQEVGVDQVYLTRARTRASWREVSAMIAANQRDRYTFVSQATVVPMAHRLWSFWDFRDDEELHAIGAPIVRDVFGNPFRPVTMDRRWLTSTVIDLARVIYDEQLFERLPILSDALLDAGCDNEDMIDHCRTEAGHVKGCWLLDLLLGRS